MLIYIKNLLRMSTFSYELPQKQFFFSLCLSPQLDDVYCFLQVIPSDNWHSVFLFLSVKWRTRVTTVFCNAYHMQFKSASSIQ